MKYPRISPPPQTWIQFSKALPSMQTVICFSAQPSWCPGIGDEGNADFRHSIVQNLMIHCILCSPQWIPFWTIVGQSFSLHSQAILAILSAIGSTIHNRMLRFPPSQWMPVPHLCRLKKGDLQCARRIRLFWKKSLSVRHWSDSGCVCHNYFL